MVGIQFYRYTFTLTCQGEQITASTGAYATANLDATAASVTQQIRDRVQAEYGSDYEVMISNVTQIYPQEKVAR